MTDLRINQLIAEYCGWQILEPEVHPTITYHWAIEPDGSKSILPDYCNDLNAMHEAMKTLSEEQVEKVWETLCDMIPINPRHFRNGLVFDAPARVRAEAFLRVIGKWKE